MFKNYIKTALRVFDKNRTYSVITILGLTTGLWACLVVATVVLDDWSYDRQWSKSADLYRIISINKMGENLHDKSESSFAGLGPELKKDYSEVIASAIMYTSELRLKLRDNEPNGIKALSIETDTSVWKMLDINVLEGTPKNYVTGNDNLLITESFRNKFFHGINPIGKIINDVPSYGDKPASYLITGVIKDLPVNTHLRAEVIKLHIARKEALFKEQYGSFVQQYLLLRSGTDAKNFAVKVNKWYSSWVGQSDRFQFEFQPIRDVYLRSDFAKNQKVKGSIKNSYIFSGVALLLLIIACINFINLSTARAVSRLRETGVRKILGAGRKQLIFQFLTEAILFFAISTFLTVILYQLSLPFVEAYLGHQLVQTFLSHLVLFACALGVIFLVSMVTGIYPAWLISGFSPALTLKGKLFSQSAYGHNWLRKSLVVMQFSISIIVLIAMIVVQGQLHFMENKDIGFNKNNLMSIGFISWDGKGNAFKNELSKTTGVELASISSWIPSNGPGNMSKVVEDPNHPGNKITVCFIWGDVDVPRTLGMRLKSGRFLTRDFAGDGINSDSLQSIGFEKFEKDFALQSSLVTATTAKMLHITKLDEQFKNTGTTPVGIVEDFHNESLRDPLMPTFITAERSPNYGGMLVRIKPGMEKQVTASVHRLWKQFFPAKLLDIDWVDDLLNKQYEAERKLQQLFMFFSALTMALAALGVFGLIVHASAQRTKEIGIRKVLGAGVATIAVLLSKDFLKLVVLAIVIASPIAGWAMKKWLQDFAYRINMTWWMFALAAFAAIVITLITVSFRAIKSALANPVESLRSE